MKLTNNQQIHIKNLDFTIAFKGITQSLHIRIYTFNLYSGIHISGDHRSTISLIKFYSLAV